MGSKAEHDLWGQALAFECQHGDRAIHVITSKVEQLRSAGEMTEADFWSEVADCLSQLHAIKWPGIVRRRDLTGTGNAVIRDFRREA